MSVTVDVTRLWLDRFRGIAELDLELGHGLTVFVGANGQGKTTLLEAVSWVARCRSFRGVPDQVLVQAGHEQAVVRAEVRHDQRTMLFEAEIKSNGRNRVMLNKSAVSRRRDLQDLLRVSVFAPDDLELVKGGPAFRRVYLDELLGSLAARYDAAAMDYERILKHRNALLRSNSVDASYASTLEVFDEQLINAGSELVRGRLQLLGKLEGELREAYASLASTDTSVECTYESGWSTDALDGSEDIETLRSQLREALHRLRSKERERKLTLVGPHRDDLEIKLGGLGARHYASQGEQRTLALSLRLAGHRVITDLTGSTPVLLLDDVFSELDESRAAALVEWLPHGQTFLTTTGVLPASVTPELTLRIENGKVCQ